MSLQTKSARGSVRALCEAAGVQLFSQQLLCQFVTQIWRKGHGWVTSVDVQLHLVGLLENVILKIKTQILLKIKIKLQKHSHQCVTVIRVGHSLMKEHCLTCDLWCVFSSYPSPRATMCDSSSEGMKTLRNSAEKMPPFFMAPVFLMLSVTERRGWRKWNSLHKSHDTCQSWWLFPYLPFTVIRSNRQTLFG